MVIRTVSDISCTQARRLAVMAQCLAGPRPRADADGVMDLIGKLGCLQLDPISVVARSHLLVLWSRLGVYDPAVLDTLLWQERRLFEYWAHAASIVAMQDYPIHQVLMRQYGRRDTPGSQRIRNWVEQNDLLHQSILNALRMRGPLRTRDFEDLSAAAWQSSGWTGNRNVGRMLDFLWTQGQILVVRRTNGDKWWDLAERCLPAWTANEVLSEREVVSRAAEKSLRALGVATERDITQHFTRGRYPGLSSVLAELEAVGKVTRVCVYEAGEELAGPWFMHVDLLPLLEKLETGAWEPRTTLLSPFDNLICDRQRTERLFRFSYRSEIYTPKDKRRYGYYVMPILHGDRLIGRIDPALDRARKQLTINAVHAEPDAPITQENGLAVANAIKKLALFLGAETINYSGRMPEIWKYVLT